MLLVVRLSLLLPIFLKPFPISLPLDSRFRKNDNRPPGPPKMIRGIYPLPDTGILHDGLILQIHTNITNNSISYKSKLKGQNQNVKCKTFLDSPHTESIRAENDNSV